MRRATVGIVLILSFFLLGIVDAVAQDSLGAGIPLTVNGTTVEASPFLYLIGTAFLGWGVGRWKPVIVIEHSHSFKLEPEDRKLLERALDDPKP